MKKCWILLYVILTTSLLQAQSNTRYLVKFKDKGNTPYTFSNPSAYLSQRAINRRTRYQLVPDSTDLPISPVYISGLQAIPNVTLLNKSKWLNQVSIQTTDPAALTAIGNLPFVQSVSPVAAGKAPNHNDDLNKTFQEMEEPLAARAARSQGVTENFYDYSTRSFNELHLHNAEFLHNIGLRGQNMQIGMLDGGFLNYNAVDGLDSMVKSGRVLGTWDFVRGNSNVSISISHGMQCLSTIAGNIPGNFIGKAPAASFYLFITEDAGSEYPIEEHNWVCGAERADSAGVDIISSSLGYSTFDNPAFNHTYADLTGNKTMAAIGADLAAKKGILVFNSAGNEGNNSWHYIMTPADADSIVAVGAVDVNGNVGSFTSYGPSADGQVKPDVASVGVAAQVITSSNTISTNNGTSFAGPNMAGMATCLWQAFPEVNNMQVIRTLRRAGSRAGSPDDRIGYGIPDMKKAIGYLLQEISSSSITTANCQPAISWQSKDLAGMQYVIERKQPGDTGFIAIHTENGTGNIFTSHSYTFTDAAVNKAGTTLYRIQQVIDTTVQGKSFVYLDTLPVTIAQNCAITEAIKILPNPTRDYLTVVLTGETAIPHFSYSILNMQGQVMARGTKNKTAGYYSFDIPVNHLAAGKYFLVTYDDQSVMDTRPFIKY